MIQLLRVVARGEILGLGDKDHSWQEEEVESMIFHPVTWFLTPNGKSCSRQEVDSISMKLAMIRPLL